MRGGSRVGGLALVGREGRERERERERERRKNNKDTVYVIITNLRSRNFAQRDERLGGSRCCVGGLALVADDVEHGARVGLFRLLFILLQSTFFHRFCRKIKIKKKKRKNSKKENNNNNNNKSKKKIRGEGSFTPFVYFSFG